MDTVKCMDCGKNYEADLSVQGAKCPHCNSPKKEITVVAEDHVSVSDGDEGNKNTT